MELAVVSIIGSELTVLVRYAQKTVLSMVCALRLTQLLEQGNALATKVSLVTTAAKKFIRALPIALKTEFVVEMEFAIPQMVCVIVIRVGKEPIALNVLVSLVICPTIIAILLHFLLLVARMIVHATDFVFVKILTIVPTVILILVTVIVSLVGRGMLVVLKFL